MKFLIASLFIANFLFSTQPTSASEAMNDSLNDNIFSKSCPSSIEGRIQDTLFQAVYCANKADRSTCYPLGSKKWYPTIKVKHQHNWEVAKGTGNAVLTLLLGVVDVATAVGGGTLDIATLGSMTPAVTIAVIGITGGTATYGVKTHRRFADAGTVSTIVDHLIGGEDTTLNLNCSDFNQYAMSIQDILNRI